MKLIFAGAFQQKWDFTSRNLVEVSFFFKSFLLFIQFFLFSDITAHETGSNKQTASKSCALSLVRQLFHLGVIEPFSGTLKKNKEAEQLKPYPVALAPELETQLMDTLHSLQISPIPIVSSQFVCPHWCALGPQNIVNIVITRGKYVHVH